MHKQPTRHLLTRTIASVLASLFGAASLSLAAVSQRLYLPLLQSAPATQSDGIVFVSRQIPPNGSIYWDVPRDMPGVGPHSRFRVAAPGKLMVLETAGRIRTLIDGSQPTSASLDLIDVNAPAVSYDASTIVFAGLPKGNCKLGPATNPSAWRLYLINVDGTGLRQITASDQQLDMKQFGAAAAGLDSYDDTDPAWLPDGRIVFSSTRWPSYAHYSGVRASNLYVIDADGSKLHRITAERNGADRPLVDLLTGKIVYARWWRNQRFPVDSMATITDPNGGFVQKDGLTADRNNPVGGETMFRNAWQAAEINPDGTDVRMWTGQFRREDLNHVYGGAFAPDGVFYANFFPMYNMTEAAGFGGIRRYTRGPNSFTPVIGITTLSKDYVHSVSPTSFGILKGSYAADPDVRSDGRLVFSYAADVNQDYGLYTTATGGGLIKLYDNPGTTEIRARIIQQRAVPPIIADRVSTLASALPPKAEGPYDGDGTFTFDALNVYANAPVDTDIVSAPAVRTAGTIRFFIDQQRTSPGSFPNLDWPILLGELQVAADGSVTDPTAPANVPLFEQVRAPDGSVPLTFGTDGDDGAAHVTGMNFSRPGTTVRCIGCHAGHSMLQVPSDRSAALWSNLAPGATVSVSSARDPQRTSGLIDRRVMKGEIWRYWNSAADQASGQWAKLTFQVPITVRRVRLYNPRPGDEAKSSLQVTQATVHLLDGAGDELASKQAGKLAVNGTDVTFSDVPGVVAVKVDIDEIIGTFYGLQVASLAEIEVVGHG